MRSRVVREDTNHGKRLYRCEKHFGPVVFHTGIIPSKIFTWPPELYWKQGWYHLSSSTFATSYISFPFSLMGW
jgi:hypothetical protein